MAGLDSSRRRKSRDRRIHGRSQSPVSNKYVLHKLGFSHMPSTENINEMEMEQGNAESWKAINKIAIEELKSKMSRLSTPFGTIMSFSK